MLCCDVFLFLVKHGTPTHDDLERISHRLGKWRGLGRRLQIREATLTEIDDKYGNISEKGYKMLLHWKQERGASAATYMVLHDALCHPLVDRRDLAEELTTGNM